MLAKEQNNSKESSRAIGPFGFRSSPKLKYLVLYSEFVVILTLNIICFLNKQGLFEFSHYFSVNLANL